MKKITSIIAIVALSIAFSTTASAQVSDNAITTATIVTPISITNNGDLSFGTVGSSVSVGTVIVAPDSGRTATPGATLSTFAAGTVSAASFLVEGESGYTYVITLPTDTAPYTITKNLSTETMTVTDFISTPATTGTLTGGSETLLVGATLNVGAGQVAGVYTNAIGFEVTVNYN